jgi:hypothetical protein
MIGITFYEATIAQHYLLAYTVDGDRQRFVVLWVCEKPGLR